MKIYDFQTSCFKVKAEVNLCASHDVDKCAAEKQKNDRPIHVASLFKLASSHNFWFFMNCLIYSTPPASLDDYHRLHGNAEFWLYNCFCICSKMYLKYLFM